MTISKANKKLLHTFLSALIADAQLVARLTDEICDEFAAHGENLPMTELYSAAVRRFDEIRRIRKKDLTYPTSEGMLRYHRVPPTFRPAFVLCDMLKFSYSNAASVCNRPIGTIRSRINRASNSLKPAVVAA